MAEENKVPGCVEEGVGAVFQPQLGSWTSGRTMGVYFFEKSLSFLSRIELVVFEILKLPPKYGQKL